MHRIANVIAALVVLSATTTLSSNIFVNAASKCPARSAPCVNARNFARCKQLKRRGCKNIVTQESCPLRFSCGDKAPASAPTSNSNLVRPPVAAPTKPPPPPAVCPAIDSPCMTAQIHETCLGLVQRGCKNLIFLTSCPYAGVGCGDELPPVPPVAPRPVPAPLPPRPNAVCPSRDSRCMNDDNFAHCNALVQAGCKQPAMSKSCPIVFACGNITVPKPAICPAANSTCMTPKIYNDCQALVKNGCKNPIFLQSCPYAGVGCGDEPIKPPVVPRPVPAPLPRPLCPPRDSACMTNDNFAHCNALVQAGCKQPAMSKSCPVQFTCGNIVVPKPDLCPAANSTCMTPALYDTCQGLVRQGCQSLVYLESCPYAGISCANELPQPELCPALDSPCMTPTIYNECQALVQNGCTNPIFLQSCPYAGVGCGN